MDGSKVFAVRDPQHGWVVCTRQGTDRDGNLLLLGPDGKRLKVAPSEAMPIASPERAAGTANLLDLVDFNEASVFLALQERLSRSLVYTFLGTSLVSVNPNYYQELYTPEVQALYRGLPSWQTHRVPPHLYSIAQFAYSELLHSSGEQAQTILLTGRVGSGKTEASKYLLQFLVSADGSHGGDSNNRKSSVADGGSLAEKLEWARVVLEAFGNAATRENYNSSRFGLLTQLFFGAMGEVIGGAFTPYLFERTRVTRSNEGERNFHVFYQLVHGATAEEKKNFVLLAPNKYRYLRAGNVIALTEVDDVGYFAALKDAFKGLKLQSTQSAIFRVLSAVLHLGNVSFVPDEETGEVKIKSPKVLNVVAALLACDENVLAQAMCEARCPPTLDDEEPPPLTKPAEDMRDLIAQTIYAKLFDWLVAELNNQIRTENASRFISILDPFGFEDCDLNGLHQLSVNYASERLFSDLIETRNSEEQEVYVEEGTNWERIDLDDGSSARCLEVFDMPDFGVWDVITEQTQDPNAVDVDVINGLCDTFAESTVLQRCAGRYEMVLQHRGGDVVYNVQGFLVQNMEAISDALWSCFEQSTAVFVKNLFPSSSRAESSSLLSVRAPGDVNFVLSLVMPTRLHFVHCLAPNTQGLADLVDGNVILMQILASGMLGTGKLRGQGYLCNMSFDETMQRYGLLAKIRPRRFQNVTSNECVRLLKALLADLDNDKLFHVGVTRVFLTHAAFRVLEAKRSARLKDAAATIAAISLRKRFARRVTELVVQKAPKRSAPKPTSPRRNLPALPSKDGVASASSPTLAAPLSRGSGVEAAVDLTRGAIGLVRMLYKEPIQRGEIVQKLKEIKSVEEEFRVLERENCGQDESYDSALEVVFTTLGVFCENVRSVCRSNENKPALLTQCKSSHNDLVMAIRSWKSEYTRFASAAKSPRVSSMQRTQTLGAPQFLSQKSTSSAALTGSPSASVQNPRRPVPQSTAAPSSARPVPELNTSIRRTTQAVSPRLSSQAVSPRLSSTSPRLSNSPISSPRGGGGQLNSSQSNAVSAGSTGTRIVFHDSPKQKRKAQTREIMSKIVSGGGSVKETLDKLDSELGIKG